MHKWRRQDRRDRVQLLWVRWISGRDSAASVPGGPPLPLRVALVTVCPSSGCPEGIGSSRGCPARGPAQGVLGLSGLALLWPDLALLWPWVICWRRFGLQTVCRRHVGLQTLCCPILVQLIPHPEVSLMVLTVSWHLGLGDSTPPSNFLRS